jgi:hypothetical protein
MVEKEEKNHDHRETNQSVLATYSSIKIGSAKKEKKKS